LPYKTLDDNTIYQISTIVTSDVTQHDLYIGSNRIGGNYNSQKIYDTNPTVMNNVGGIKKGTPLLDLLNKGSISAILDDILFKETYLTDYWEDIDAVLEENPKNLL
jgi:hypothetical protein